MAGEQGDVTITDIVTGDPLRSTEATSAVDDNDDEGNPFAPGGGYDE